MKVLFRINYAILMVAAFLLVGRQAFIKRYNKFYYEEGSLILESDNENKQKFFYEAKGIHQEEPFASYGNERVRIDFFEINVINHGNKDYVLTYLFPMVEFKEELPEEELIYVLNFKRNMPGDESVYPYILFNFVNLDLYFVDSSFNDMLPIMIGEEEYDLVDKNIISFEVFSTNDDYEIVDEFYETNFQFNRNSFPVRNELTSLLNHKAENNEPLQLTEEEIIDLENKNIIFQEYHDARKYNRVLYLWFGIYFGIFIVSAYFVFFFHPKRKRLGRVKPTKPLVESIKKSEQKKKE